MVDFSSRAAIPAPPTRSVAANGSQRCLQPVFREEFPRRRRCSFAPLPFRDLSRKPSPPPSGGNKWLFFLETVKEISEFDHKVRKIALVKKAIAKFRHFAANPRPRHLRRKKDPQTEKAHSLVTATEYFDAEATLLEAIQHHHFRREILKLKENAIDSPTARQSLSASSSKIKSLNPFIADDGLMRLGGRLVNSLVNSHRKFPIILPKDDDNVRCLIDFVHKQEHHRGPTHILAVLRRKYWIINGLRACKSAVHRCVRCQMFLKAPEQQRMAPLPEERVAFNAPFEVTGVDLMGPFSVIFSKDPKSKTAQKMWVAVFTCFSSRAVHAECVSKLDADSFINAVVRFTSRRPGLRKFVSDNGTNFVATNVILRQQLENFRRQSVVPLATRGIEWEFIPPGMPSYGGCWERVVGLFKRMIASLGRAKAHRFDAFSTAIISMESVLNRRPLCTLTSSPDDLEPLTPNHILHPATFAHSSATIIPDGVFSDADALQSNWKRAQVNINAAKKLFFDQYLPILQERRKWAQAKTQLAVGDVVLLVDEAKKRHNWSLARVTEVEGSDLVRRVHVKNSEGKDLRLDRNKVVKLELSS